GVRGDMKAVVRAVLLDSEARSLSLAGQPAFGKLTEPLIRFVQYFRAFKGHSASGYYELQFNLNGPTALNQSPFFAPSVFNFYHPNFMPAGPLTQANLVGPEFEITNASSVAGFSSFSKYALLPGYAQGPPPPPPFTALSPITPDYSYYLGLTNLPGQLLDDLELVLCARCLNPTVKVQIAQAVNKIFWNENLPGQSQERLYTALWLIINSPDFSVQR
ncbi:MAG: DUF1800 family protein, partial [Gammaproteobacteria bacterium]